MDNNGQQDYLGKAAKKAILVDPVGVGGNTRVH